MASNLKRILQSNLAYRFLDRTANRGSTWFAGACYLLSRALAGAVPGSTMVALSDRAGRIQHWVVQLRADVVLDGNGTSTWYELQEEERVSGAHRVTPTGCDHDHWKGLSSRVEPSARRFLIGVSKAKVAHSRGSATRISAATSERLRTPCRRPRPCLQMATHHLEVLADESPISRGSV